MRGDTVRNNARDVLRSYDAAQSASWHDEAMRRRIFGQSSGLFWFSKEQHMPSSKRAGIIGARQSDIWLPEGPSKPALRAGIWARLLAALHESRKKEAALVIFRHREFIGNFKSIELLRSQVSTRMHDRQTDRYTLMERFLIVLMIGFAFALGFALYQFDAAVKEISSSLAGFAPIGSWPF